MTEQGFDLQFKTNPKSITKQPDGPLLVETEDGRKLEIDCAMYATGRVPKTEGPGLEEAGVKLTSNGTVIVDEYSKASCDSIYATGDVTDRMQFTPVALHEGMCLANHLSGPEGGVSHEARLQPRPGSRVL